MTKIKKLLLIFCLIACLDCRAASLGDSITAWYKMNDISDNNLVIDSMDFSDGTAQQNTEDLHTTGKIDGALSFNGTSDYINTNSTFETVIQNGITVNICCNPTSLSGEVFMIIGAFSTSPRSYFEQYINSAGGMFTNYFAGGNDIGYDSNASVSVENWQMLTFVVEKVSSSSINILHYKNGVLIGESGEQTCSMSEYESTQNLYIGAANGNEGVSEFFNGFIDNVMIFDKALTQKEINILYRNGRGTEDINWRQKLAHLR